MANPWDNDPIVRAAPSKSGGGMPWDNDPIVKAAEPKTGVVEDVAKSAASGAARGGLGLVGLPGSIASGVRWVADQAADQTVGRAVNYAKTGSFEAPSPPPSADLLRERTGIPDPGQAISGQALTDAAASVVPGIKYQPQTEAGKVAATIGEFTPGLLSPGTMAQRVVGGVLAPALTSEALGRTAAHLSPSLEQPARLVGALAGGVAGTLATRPSTAQAAVSAGMRGVDDATITAAGQLMQEANARGISLTWPEAIAQASNGGGRGLTNMQRVVEGSQGGGDVMGAFMAQRPAQIEAAGRQAFSEIAPQTANPSAIGRQAQGAARAALSETPEGQLYAQRLFEAGPRMSPERAGQIIQPELRSVYERREGMRAALADQDYSAARNAPATVPLNGGFGFRDVAKHYDGPDIPILTDAADRAAARTAQMAERNPVERMPVIGIKPTEFGQVDASAVASHLDEAISGAKGAVRQGLQAAKSALYRPDGAIDVTVGGLHNSRMAITDLIDQAKLAGANNTVRELQGALSTLDQALEAVPAYGQARRNFEAASRPLAPFSETRVPGQIVAKDQYGRDYLMPPEQAGRAVIQGGPSAARDFNTVASGPAREALEAQLTTQVLDSAVKGGTDLSSKAIWNALRQNEDLLAQYPGVRTRLENIAVAKDGMKALENTPLGQIAKRDATTGAAVRALFPDNPLPGSSGEVSNAVKALADKSPTVARQLVRIHAESIFNQATSALQSGANQFGGAGFVAALKGNPQQAENLSAAIRGAAGPETAKGFDTFLDVLSATGQRQRIGSQTAFNQETQDILRRGGMIGEAANTVATAGVKLPGRVKEAYEQWRLGRNTEQIAKLFTDPNAIEMFRRLGRAAPGSSQAQAISARLAIMATQASQAANRPVP